MSRTPYPPPPWRLHGEAAILVAPVRVADARAAGVPPGARLRSVRGWTLGGALLARYDEQATLPYHELIVFSALATPEGGGGPAFVVSHIYVDLEASLRGGREIWGLPKELATFDWSARAVSVTRADGCELLRAHLRRSRGAVTVPLYAPVLGSRDVALLRTAGRGRLGRAAPALARLDVPPQSPFAALGIGGTRAGIAGDALDLRFPAPS